MPERKQINIRLEIDVLAAIQSRCEQDSITQTDFIANAVKAALGMPVATTAKASPVAVGDIDAIKVLSERIAEVEKRLAERIAPLEELPGKLTA